MSSNYEYRIEKHNALKVIYGLCEIHDASNYYLENHVKYYLIKNS